MTYNFNELRFPSSDGKNTIYAEIYTPKNVAPRGIVQLAHGMIDYTARYTELASFLCSHGFIFADSQYQFGKRYSKVDKDTGERVSESIHVDDDSYYRLTAKNVSVLDIMWDDPDLLATKTDPAAGVDEYGNIGKLIDMTTDKNAASFRGAATADFLVCILADVALNANSANTFYNTYTNVGKSIDNQRISISGVDKDEEAVSLVKYQNAYNRASRMIQTLTEIYDRLILQTGV